MRLGSSCEGNYMWLMEFGLYSLSTADPSLTLSQETDMTRYILYSLVALWRIRITFLKLIIHTPFAAFVILECFWDDERDQ